MSLVTSESSVDVVTFSLQVSQREGRPSLQRARSSNYSESTLSTAHSHAASTAGNIPDLHRSGLKASSSEIIMQVFLPTLIFTVMGWIALFLF